MATDEIKQSILDFLGSIPDKWEYSSQIAQAIGYNRVTVAKYLDVLLAEKKIQQKIIGKAKLWSLSEPAKPIVLVVDDEPHIVQLIKLSLDSELYSVIEAHDGQEGVDKAFSYSPDVIILDIMMPKKDGYAVCKELKSHVLTQHIPIIFLSAKQQVDDKIKGFTLGADQYMPKPFDPMELEARVNSVLKKKQAQNSRHAITGLPTAFAVEQFKKKNPGVTSTCFRITHLDVVREVFGYRKYEEMLQFVSKLLSLEVKDDSPLYIGHVDDDEFVVLSKKFSLDRFSKSLFDTLPFLYGVESFEKGMFVHNNTSYPVITLEKC